MSLFRGTNHNQQELFDGVEFDLKKFGNWNFIDQNPVVKNSYLFNPSPVVFLLPSDRHERIPVQFDTVQTMVLESEHDFRPIDDRCALGDSDRGKTGDIEYFLKCGNFERKKPKR